MREYLFVLVMAAAVTYVATPLVRWFAFKVGALDPVRDRDMHAEPMPRLGGVGMFCGFAAAVLLAWKLPFLSQVFASGEPQAVLLGAGLVCALGVIDDLRGLDALTKLAGQLLAAGLMAYQGIQLLSLPLFGVTVLPTPVLVGLTVLVVVVTINAVNFVDGLDGLAAGIVGIAAVAFFTYSYLLARAYDPNVFSAASLITAALIGCCAGFLPHNFNPARIFMGDSGSMLLGLLLAAATISLTGNVDPANVPLRLASYVPIMLPDRGAAAAVAGPGARRHPAHPGRPEVVAAGHGAPAPPAAGDRSQPRPRGPDHVPVDRRPDLRRRLVRLRAGPYGDRGDRRWPRCSRPAHRGPAVAPAAGGPAVGEIAGRE